MTAHQSINPEELSGQPSCLHAHTQGCGCCRALACTTPELVFASGSWADQRNFQLAAARCSWGRTGGMGIPSSETRGWNCKTILESACKPSSDISSGVDKPLGMNPIFEQFLGHLFFSFFLSFNSFGLDLLLSKDFFLHRSSSWGRQELGIWDENLLAYFPDQQLNLGGKHDSCYKSECWGSLAEILQTCAERSKLWWHESF